MENGHKFLITVAIAMILMANPVFAIPINPLVILPSSINGGHFGFQDGRHFLENGHNFVIITAIRTNLTAKPTRPLGLLPPSIYESHVDFQDGCHFVGGTNDTFSKWSPFSHNFAYITYHLKRFTSFCCIKLGSQFGN